MKSMIDYSTRLVRPSLNDVERLVTVVELDEQDPNGHSPWAHLYVELSTGARHGLALDRGWSSSAEIADEGLTSIETTARMVVRPDGPGPGETDEQMDSQYWEWLERKLRRQNPGRGRRAQGATS